MEPTVTTIRRLEALKRRLKTWDEAIDRGIADGSPILQETKFMQIAETCFMAEQTMLTATIEGIKKGGLSKKSIEFSVELFSKHDKAAQDCKKESPEHTLRAESSEIQQIEKALRRMISTHWDVVSEISKNGTSEIKNLYKNEIELMKKSLNERASLFQVFVSYAHADKESANAILPFVQEKLKEKGSYISIWKDSNEIRLGDRWENELEKKLKTLDVGALFISEHFLTAKYVRKELGILNAQIEKKKDSKIIAPIIISKNAWKKLNNSDEFPFTDLITAFQPCPREDELDDLPESSLIEHINKNLPDQLIQLMEKKSTDQYSD